MTDNDKKRFMSAMVAMFKSFNRPEDKDVVKLFFEGMRHMSVEDSELCIGIVIKQADKFPTISEIRRAISQIPAKPVPRIEYKNKYESMPSDAEKLIQMALEGTISKENLIEGMLVMDKKYPGIGWSEDAASLAAHFIRNEREENPRYAD